MLYEHEDGVVIIDPLVPRDTRETFLSWLDDRIGDRYACVLTTIRWHERDSEFIRRRYASRGREVGPLALGVCPTPLAGALEVVYWLPDVATLVPGDRILGDAGHGLRLCPQSWLKSAEVDRERLAELLRPLLDLPIQRVLVSHGQPVLSEARSALANAIEDAGG